MCHRQPVTDGLVEYKPMNLVSNTIIQRIIFKIVQVPGDESCIASNSVQWDSLLRGIRLSGVKCEMGDKTSD